MLVHPVQSDTLNLSVSALELLNTVSGKKVMNAETQRIFKHYFQGWDMSIFQLKSEFIHFCLVFVVCSLSMWSWVGNPGTVNGPSQWETTLHCNVMLSLIGWAYTLKIPWFFSVKSPVHYWNQCWLIINEQRVSNNKVLIKIKQLHLNEKYFKMLFAPWKVM